VFCRCSLAVLSGLAEAGYGTAFDGGGGQLVDVKPAAQQLQEAHLGVVEPEVGGGYLDGKRIGGLVETRRQGIADGFERNLKALRPGNDRLDIAGRG
jgi:hypothetical protein